MGDHSSLCFTMDVDFPDRKLPKEAASSLTALPVESFAPRIPVMAPVYVYLKLNEKFVMVKQPLDFFVTEELERLRPYGNFSVPPERPEVARFRKIAHAARSVLTWTPGGTDGRSPLAPASYEVSDAILRLLAPLWDAGGSPSVEAPGPRTDPLGVVLFVSELCEPLPGDLLEKARELNVKSYFRAQFCASWLVFLGLHLGYCDLAYLNRLRKRAFELEAGARPDGEPLAGSRGEPDDLLRLVRCSLPERLPSLAGSLIGAEPVIQASGKASRKLAARFERLERLAHA